MKNVHFIAIGGAVMHYLAINLKKQGYQVSGSDDEIFDPSKTRLEVNGLLPSKMGFFEENIQPNLDLVIVGMHAKADNIELLRAKKLGIKTVSFPEFVYEFSKEKNRVVIAGSHGKTTISSMIVHVLKECERQFDYVTGAVIDGLDGNVYLSKENDLVIIEGDEYLSSALQPIPKFLFYKANIAVISGIAWDHINVFPTFENYLQQFKKFVESVEVDAALIYNVEDEELQKLMTNAPSTLHLIAYHTPKYRVHNEVTYVQVNEQEIALNVFGKHNLQNMEAARAVCEQLGIDKQTFYKKIASFSGASNRLSKFFETRDLVVYRDFAHSPSKLKATVASVREQYADRHLIAVMELHTYSSLKKDFLPQYEHCMEAADEAVVFYDPHAIQLKRLEPITQKNVMDGFKQKDLLVYNQADELAGYLKNARKQNCVYLLMSSGNFGGINLKEIFS